MTVIFEHLLEPRASLLPAAPTLCRRSEDRLRQACAPPSFHGSNTEWVVALGEAYPPPILFLPSPDDPDPCVAPFRRVGEFPHWSA